MLKPILLGGAMLIAAPAIAQDAAAPHLHNPTMEAATEPVIPDTDRDRRGLSYWVNTGDMGVLGSREWGLASTWGSHAHAHMDMNPPVGTRNESDSGMGGPVDIDSQWSSISAGGDSLDRLEFGTWLLEQSGEDVARQVEATRRSRAANLPAVQVLNFTGAAFADADKDGDMRISRDELRAFAEE